MTPDERQAAMDALNAIMQARQASKIQGGKLPPGEFEIEVDPELDTPEISANPLDDDDIEIDDPDNVLKDQKEKQKNRSKSGSNKGKGQKPNEKPDENNPDEPQEPGEPGDPGNLGEPGKGGGGSKGPKQNPDPQGPGKGEKGEQGESDPQKGGLPQEYIDAWNEIIDRYDRDEITDTELEDLIAQIKNGNLTNL